MIDGLMRHKMIVFLIIALVAIGLWYGTSSTKVEPALSSSQVSLNGEDRQIAETLLRLKAISLDGMIFQNPVFVQLKDFSVQIVAEPVGRPDPFAKLSPGAQATVDSTQSAKIFKPKR